MSFCLPGSTSCEAQTALLAVGVVLAILVWILYVRLILNERRNVLDPIYRIQVLSLRIGLVVPIFAVIAVFSIAFPEALAILEFVQAAAEGYAIYCFFKMVLFSVGPDRIVRQIIKNSSATGCLFFSFPLWAVCQRQPACLSIIRFAFLQFLFLRPLWLLLAGIFELKYRRSGDSDQGAFALFRFFVAMGVAGLVLTLPAILRVYETLARHMPEIAPGKKVIFVKLFILLWVIQNNVLNFMHQNASESVIFLQQRVFSFVVMVELFVLSLLFPLFFTTRQALLDKVAKETAAVGAVSPAASVSVPFSYPSTPTAFVLDTLCIWKYAFDSHEDEGGLHSQSLALSLFPHHNQPRSSSSSSSSIATAEGRALSASASSSDEESGPSGQSSPVLEKGGGSSSAAVRPAVSVDAAVN